MLASGRLMRHPHVRRFGRISTPNRCVLLGWMPTQARTTIGGTVWLNTWHKYYIGSLA
jgi:hypothetical protein